jgi:hypothetical protein
MPHQRRTKHQIARIRKAIRSVLEDNNPQTVRQVFYRLVSLGEIEKTEREYKGTIVKQLTKMRLGQEIPYSWIADNTRWQRKPRTYDSVQDASKSTALAYRRNVLNSQDCYIEVWMR